jgi:hypothetical protein
MPDRTCAVRNLIQATEIMKARLAASIFAAVLALSVSAQVQRSTPQARTGSAETRLVGISLFDTGAKVVTVYGSPDDIQALNVGGGGAAGGGPAGAPGGPAGAPAGGGRGFESEGGGGNETAFNSRPSIPINQNDAMPGFIGDPFGVGRLRQFGPPPGAGGGGGPQAGAGAFGPPPGAGGGGAPGAAGAPGGFGAPGGGGTGAPAGGGAAARTVYTRWVYNRGGSRYGFILDKFNRVVQIEAIGMKDSKVRTRRGIGFGAYFDRIIKTYGAPDGYEISGNSVVVRYLVFDRVAFRMSKLTANGKHCVTGVVVAAGKT